MYRKKAYVHWYAEQGMDETEFAEALSNVKDLIDDYHQYQEAGIEVEDADDEDGMDLEDGEQIDSSSGAKFHKEAMSSLQSFSSKTTRASNNLSL